MTRTKETVNNGYKANSMYQEHSVIGQANEVDMRKYYAKESEVNHTRLHKPNAMHVEKFEPVDLFSIAVEV